MPIRAILWDNDGVLVDTEELYFRATHEVLESVGVELTEQLYLQLFLVEARGAWHLARAKGLSSEQLAALRERRDQRYLELIARWSKPLPGVAEALRALHPFFRMAIVTSSQAEPFAMIHRHTGLLPFFELVLTREDYQNCKPDPEPYLRAVERLGLQSTECLVIEDSERGLRAAKAAGLLCWVIPHGPSRNGNFAQADRTFEKISDAAEELLRQVRP